MNSTNNNAIIYGNKEELCSAYQAWFDENQCESADSASCTTFVFNNHEISGEQLEGIDSFCSDQAPDDPHDPSDKATNDLLNHLKKGIVLAIIAVIITVIALIYKWVKKDGDDDGDDNNGGGSKKIDNSRPQENAESTPAQETVQPTTSQKAQEVNNDDQPVQIVPQENSNIKIPQWEIRFEVVRQQLEKLLQGKKRLNPVVLDFYTRTAIDYWNELVKDNPERVIYFWEKDIKKSNVYHIGSLPFSFIKEHVLKRVLPTSDIIAQAASNSSKLIEEIMGRPDVPESARSSVEHVVRANETIFKDFLLDRLVGATPDKQIVMDQLKRLYPSIADQPAVLSYLSSLAISSWMLLRDEEKVVYFDNIMTLPQPGEISWSYLTNTMRRIDFDFQDELKRSELLENASVYDQLVHMEEKAGDPKYFRKVHDVVSLLNTVWQFQQLRIELIFGRREKETRRLSAQLVRLSRAWLEDIVSPVRYMRSSMQWSFDPNTQEYFREINLSAVKQMLVSEFNNFAYFHQLLDLSAKAIVNYWLDDLSQDIRNKINAFGSRADSPLVSSDTVPRFIVKLWMDTNIGLYSRVNVDQGTNGNDANGSGQTQALSSGGQTPSPISLNSQEATMQELVDRQFTLPRTTPPPAVVAQPNGRIVLQQQAPQRGMFMGARTLWGRIARPNPLQQILRGAYVFRPCAVLS